MPQTITLGIDTFGDITYDESGTPLPAAQVLRNVVTQGVMADRAGVDAIGIGEHHRADFAVSAPEVVLAAIAGQTERIRLGSSVTVLSSDDPVRVFQRFSTLNAISNGRAEVTLGRGSFIESFPLFGFDLNDYETLFDEKLNLFVEILKEQPVTWSGTLRPPLREQSVFPHTENGPLTSWVGVGGSPESVIRAARYGLPLMIAIIGGSPTHFHPLVALYREALERFGHPTTLPIGVHSPGFVAESDEEAKDILWPHYEATMNRIGRERGWAPISRGRFEQETSPEGALVVGSPDTVAQKIAHTATTLGLSRFDLKISNGSLSREHLLRTIDLYGHEVAPRVNRLLS